LVHIKSAWKPKVVSLFIIMIIFLPLGVQSVEGVNFLSVDSGEVEHGPPKLVKLEIMDCSFNYADITWGTYGMGLGEYFAEKEAYREGDTSFSGFKFSLQVKNQSTSNALILLNLEEETFEGTISGVMFSPNVTWGDYYERGYDHMGYVTPPNGLYAYKNSVEYSGVISGRLEPIGWHDPPDALQYRLNGTADLELTFRAQLLAYKTITGGPEIITSYYEVQEEKTISCNAVLSDSFSWNKKYTNLNGGGFNIWFRDYENGPVLSFHSSGSGDAFDDLYEVLEWYEGSTLEISGPENVDSEMNSTLFRLVGTGSQADKVEKVEWKFSYMNDEGIKEQRTIEEMEFGDLRLSRGEDPFILEEWEELAKEHGELKQEGRSLNMSVTATGYDINEDLLMESNTHNFTYRSISSMEGRYTVTGFNYPMKFLEITYNDGKTTHTTSTNENGVYEIPSENKHTFELEFAFKYVEDNKNYFKIIPYAGLPSETSSATQSTPEALKIEMKIEDEKITEATAFGGNGYQHKYRDTLTPLKDLKLDSLLSENRWSDYVQMYQYFSDTVEFYKDDLKVDLDFRLPLTVIVNVPNAPRGSYNIRYVNTGSKNEIWIEEKNSGIQSDLAPKNREYHEFSHFVMRDMYGKWPEPENPKIPEVNHAGFINPSTSDSYVEGFAIFMSMIIGEKYSTKWNLPQSPWECANYGSLEINYQAFEKKGKAEEFAVAGALWDLYDGEKQNEILAAQAARAKSLIFQQMLKEYDFDSNGVIEGIEVALVGAGETNLLSLPNTNKILQDLTPVESYVDYMFSMGGASPPNMEKSQIKDYWDSIRDKHLDLMKDFNSEGVADEMIRIGDRNGDGALNGDEAKTAYKQVLHGFMQELVKDPVISAEISGIKLKFSSSSDLVLFDVLFEKMSDDDRVSIPFNEIWGILKSYHADFTSVYSALVEKYPILKTEIDRIFISHGFFRETTQGNGNWDADEPFRDGNNNGVYNQGEYYIDYPVGGFKYDIGETVGSASDAGRTTRRSGISFPGHYIKVDERVPTYNVEIILYDDSIIKIPFPFMINTIQVQNDGGLIYIPVPPPTYNSEIIVEPDAVQFVNQLVIKTDDFYDSYERAIEQGFYEEHDFGVTGAIPPKRETSITWMESSEPESPSEPEPTKPSGIPGFGIEPIIVGMILSALILWIMSRRTIS
jgi:hypothetical protein